MRAAQVRRAMSPFPTPVLTGSGSMGRHLRLSAPAMRSPPTDTAKPSRAAGQGQAGLRGFHTVHRDAQSPTCGGIIRSFMFRHQRGRMRTKLRVRQMACKRLKSESRL